MKLIQVTGYKKSGKTTLICGLLERLAQRGMNTGVIKHVHTRPEAMANDSAAFLQAGAGRVMIDDGTYLFDQKKSVSIESAAAEFTGVDVLFVEGMKEVPLPRILCVKGDPGEAALRANLIAEVSMEEGASSFSDDILEMLILRISETDDFMADGRRNKEMGGECRGCGADCRDENEKERLITVDIDGKRLGLMPFVEKALAGTLTGFLRTLKGYSNGEITIRVSDKEEK